MEEFFFPATRKSLNNITNMYNAVWPMAVGLWNLRCMVKGIQAEYPTVSHIELAGKFCVGSGIKRLDFRNGFLGHTWAEQQSDFAWILLNSTFPIYESWIQDMKENVFIHTKIKEKHFEFPDKIEAEIKRIQSDQSDMLTQSLYPVYLEKKKNKKEYSLSEIKNLLYCYRVFKEMRNCYMHKGSIASEKLMEAYNEYIPCCNPQDINMKEKLELPSLTLGAPIIPSLRGVVGFSAVLIRILVTLDTELMCSRAAEKVFDQQFKDKHRSLPSLNPDKQKALAQIKRYVKQSGFLPPVEVEVVMAYLLSKGVVSK